MITTNTGNDMKAYEVRTEEIAKLYMDDKEGCRTNLERFRREVLSLVPSGMRTYFITKYVKLTTPADL